MRKYDFKCNECDHVQTVKLSVDDFDDTKEAGIDCTECDGTADFVFDAEGMMFSFKGDAWADKNYAEKKYRKRRSKYMARRQEKNHIRPTLKPNYKGEEAQSWEEAQDAARADGKSTLSYEPLIHRERAKQRGN